MNRIYFIREENDLTQKEFSKLINIDRSLVSKWETEDCIPAIKKVNLISNYFDISFDYIFNISSVKNIEFKRKDLDKKIISQRLRHIRDINNLSLRKLANELNTTSSTISAYEMGKTLLLPAFALQICKKYNVSLDWLYGKID